MGKPILIEEPDAQEVYYDICCGIDVHQKTVVACLLRPNRKKDQKVRHQHQRTERIGAMAVGRKE